MIIVSWHYFRYPVLYPLLFYLGFFMLKIYGIKNCNSVKKTLDLITALGLAYEFHDYKKQGIDADHVEKWLAAKGSEVILNKKGTTWKKLSAAEQQLALSSQAQLIDALTTHTSLIKRPVIETEHDIIVGFNEDDIRALSKN